MLILAILILAGVVFAWRGGGPLLAMLVSWLICTAPVALGLIQYDYLGFAGSAYLWLIGGSIVAYALGAGLASAGRPTPVVDLSHSHDWDADLRRWRPAARVCRLVAYVAVACLAAQVVSLGGAVADLQTLRSDVIEANSASILARLASVMTWACFFCLAFALYFRDRLTRVELWSYIAAASGTFLSALILAGRQSVFQVILLVLILETLRARRVPRVVAARGRTLRWGLVVAGAGFLAFVTMTRTTTGSAESKSDLLLYFFNARLAPRFEALLDGISTRLRDVFVEFLLYTTHTVPLFTRFLQIDFGRHYYGMLDFPFVFRQFEGVFGYNVIEALRTKETLLNADSVIGVGWTTAFSALMMDFGTVGALVFLFLLGYLSQRVALSVRRGAGFGMVVLLTMAIIMAIYLPFLSVWADTSILFLTLVVAGVELAGRASRRGGPARMIATER